MNDNSEQKITQIDGIKLDLSSWPVIVIAPENGLTVEKILEFLEVYSDIIRSRSERFATLVDLRKCANLPPRQRRILTDGMKRNKQFNMQYCVGTAMVFNSTIIRGVLTALFWIFKPEHATKVFKNFEEAMSWAQHQFQPQ
jgi:hypothetical protein